jgi:dimeric dUTPase (all-alpha-NTP-PPase superfamily)
VNESSFFYVVHQLCLHLKMVAETASETECFKYIIDDGKSTKYEECFEISYTIFKPQKN